MSMISMWRQIIRNKSVNVSSSLFFPVSSRFFSTSPYLVKVGIPEFLRGIGKGVEAHVEKLETEFGGDLNKLIVVRTLKLKKLKIPCKDRKQILNHTHKYRLGLWRPRADKVKV